MLTVPEAAKRANRNPETIRRWIRAGRLPSRKVGTQHVIEEADLDAVLDDEYEMLPLPDAWKLTAEGDPMPNVVRAVHEARRGR
jgi:excisionase family DNA binding protein